jgi:hypothetical protein
MPRKFRSLRRGTALNRSERKEFGPIQIMVIGLNDLSVQGDIVSELRHLRDLEIIRLVDLVVVAKQNDGELVGVKVVDSAEKSTDKKSTEKFRGIAAELVGLGAVGKHEDTARVGGFQGDDQTWSVAETIPAGSIAVVALIEHRWAIPARDSIERLGGSTLADGWLEPEDLAYYEAMAAASKDRP